MTKTEYEVIKNKLEEYRNNINDAFPKLHLKDIQISDIESQKMVICDTIDNCINILTLHYSDETQPAEADTAKSYSNDFLDGRLDGIDKRLDRVDYFINQVSIRLDDSHSAIMEKINALTGKTNESDDLRKTNLEGVETDSRIIELKELKYKAETEYNKLMKKQNRSVEDDRRIQEIKEDLRFINDSMKEVAI